MIQVKLCSVPVSDQSKARTFYTEVLGFQVNKDIPMGPYAWLTVVSPAAPQGVELLLEPTAGHAQAPIYQKSLYDAGIPWTMWATNDIDAEYARLTGLGVVFHSPPVQTGPTRGCRFDDTCGNWIQLYQG